MTIRDKPRARRRLVVFLMTTLALAGVACDGGGGDPTVASSPGEETASATPSTSPSAVSSPPEPGGDHPACEPAQRIADLDDQVTNTLTEELNELLTQVASGGQPSDAQFQEFLTNVQKIVQEQVPDLLAAYDEFAATLPEDLAKDAETLREFTADFTEQIAQLSPEELENIDKIFQGPEAIEAAGATLALDQFTQKECGIVLAD